MKYKSYKKSDDYSYVFGAFPVIELLENSPEIIREIIISEKYNEIDELVGKLETKGIKYSISDKSIRRIADKGNIYLIAVFDKKRGRIEDGNHIVLHEPSDMGNLGTIIRTMLGFGFRDLAIVGNSCDHFNPKVIRASMGAFFKINIEYFEDIDDYLNKFKDREIYSFILSSDNQKKLVDIKSCGRYSLIFGNEGSGLPTKFESIGDSVLIPQSEDVDSLNLTIAAAVAMFWFKENVEI
ncbi:MAG: RNA methyltransferase [Tissierellia bacterium]|nr:RNA methyltransferase [Tissierellia bacterium]